MQSLKLLVAFLACTIFIFSFSKVGVMVANQWHPHTKSFSEETLIANEEVGNTSKMDAEEKMEASKNNWLINGNIFLEWTGELLPLPKESFQFYVSESIENAVDGTANVLQVELPIGVLLEHIETISQNNEIISSLDTEALRRDLEEIASVLKEDNHTLSLADYLVEEGLTEQTSYQISMTVAGSSAIAELRDSVHNKEITLTGNAPFSFHGWLAEENLTLSDEAASILASVLYQLIAPTNFQIIERHISKELPSWASAGYEAKVKEEKMDFLFMNPNREEYKVTISVDSMSITGMITGGPLPYTYEIKQVEKKSLPPKTVVQYSSKLMSNQKVVKDTGKPGEYIYLERVATDHEGNVVETSMFSEDFYAPLQRIEEHSLKKPVAVTDPPANNTGPPNNNGTTNPPNSNTGSNTGSNSGSNNQNNNGNENTGNNGQTNNNNQTGSNTGIGNNQTDDKEKDDSDQEKDKNPGYTGK